MSILGKKGQIWTKKGKKGQDQTFSQTVNLNFLKEDHYTSFYTKNQQNSMKTLEDISSNVDSGPFSDTTDGGENGVNNMNNLPFENISYESINSIKKLTRSAKRPKGQFHEDLPSRSLRLNNSGICMGNFTFVATASASDL